MGEDRVDPDRDEVDSEVCRTRLVYGGLSLLLSL